MRRSRKEKLILRIRRLELKLGLYRVRSLFLRKRVNVVE